IFFFPAFALAALGNLTQERSHKRLLGREVVDVQGDLPAVGALADLGDAAAELAAQRLAVGRARRRHQRALPGQQTEIPGPGAAARPLVPVLGDVGHPEGLVEEAAAMVPVAEGLPAGAAEESEGHAALSHDAQGSGAGGPAARGLMKTSRRLFLAGRLSWLLMEIAAGPGKGPEAFPGRGGRAQPRWEPPAAHPRGGGSAAWRVMDGPWSAPSPFP
uniref:Uncharacterized protein n=1 Tax=Anser brachyrhynchus TaxID=132585 RepID=A0A8B9BB72_9AVES